MGTGVAPAVSPPETLPRRNPGGTLKTAERISRTSGPPIPSRHLTRKEDQALGRLVPVPSTPCGASSPGLSTWFSSTGLTRLPGERAHLGASFALRCFQRLSLPDIATQRLPRAGQLVHQRSVHSGPLVLGAAPLNPLTPTMDRDRTVSRRSEPSSRTALIGEQPNPWDLIQPQDATSRHRGAKPGRRCERLGQISLLSPG